MKIRKGSELIEIIRPLSELGYCRVIGWQGVAHGGERPPLTVWRFAESQPGLEMLIQEAVSSFEGRVDWIVHKPTRNWVIQPLKVKEFWESRGFNNDVLAAIAFGEEFPDEVVAAYEDLPELADHLRRHLSQQASSSAVRSRQNNSN
jgi:hypothetical protein